MPSLLLALTLQLVSLKYPINSLVKLEKGGGGDGKNTSPLICII
jgi:hypothetical protein